MTPTRDAANSELTFSNVTIGVLTALREEYVACRDIFDPDGQGVEMEKRASSGTFNSWLCSIPSRHGGGHVVAITRLPHMGNTAAAIAANILLQHCDAIRSLIMCGIAGAVPHPNLNEKHVRLGDIVVSDQRGIIQYDFGKQRDPLKARDDPFNGFEFRSSPRSPCQRLLAAVERMHADEMLLARDDLREWEKTIKDFLQRHADVPRWKRPAKDELVDAADGTGTTIKHPKDPERRGRHPRVFPGAIGAANIVLADPKKRDALGERWDLRAVEMEGSGVADASWIAEVGYLVVRGTCDYCNSTKNDAWHWYAAVIAAAYVRTVIEYLHAESPQQYARVPVALEIPSRPLTFPTYASSAPPKIDASELSAQVAQQSPGREEGTGPMKHVATPPISIGMTAANHMTISGGAGISSAPAEIHALSPDYRRIQEFIERIKALLQNGRWKETIHLAIELERLLQATPRRGTQVRDGWLLLSKIEVARLHNEKGSGKTPNVTRLQQLRKEAESVLD